MAFAGMVCMREPFTPVELDRGTHPLRSAFHVT